MRIGSSGACLTALLFSFFVPMGAKAQKFYSDDPLVAEPPPDKVEQAGHRSLNALYAYMANRFAKIGEQHPVDGVIPAGGINTLGDVLDGPWFVNRHGRRQLTAEILARGAGDSDPPNPGGPWRIVSFTKDEVRRSSLWIRDADGSLYILRFDPPDRLEMSTGAAMIGSRLFHAMGYWVPENYLVYFDRSRLEIAPPEEQIDPPGAYRLIDSEIDLFLNTVARDPQKGYRAVAVRIPRGEERLGPFLFYGTRSDDSNDITPHEHRRDLRGLYVLSSWVGNNWISASQTQDVLLKENNVPVIRHYIEDFLTILGSGFSREKGAREGFESLFSFKRSLKNFAGFGFYSHEWQRTGYPEIDSVGLFESTIFDPAAWQPNYSAAALANHLPDDDYWAAKLLMAFTDEDIRTIVETAQYSDIRARNWISGCLIDRRDKIGRYYFERVLPLDNFRLDGFRLKYDDLAARHGFRKARDYTIRWSAFNNLTGKQQPIPYQAGWNLPHPAQTAEAGAYYSAQIAGDNPGKTVTVYFRKEPTGFRIVGIDRSWPSKKIADRSAP
jgi:hypothetical protein